MLQPSKPITSPCVVPMPTVYTRTPRSAAILAASSGSGPVVRCPSVSMMIAAELYEPGATGVNFFFASSSVLPIGLPGKLRCPVTCWISMPWSGNSVARLRMMPLPVAVPRCSWKRSIAASTSSRLTVGACTTAAVPANETTPTLTSRGRLLTKALAASWEATSRFGLTSSARMLPDTSIASMMVRSASGSTIVAVGRASANSSAPSAASISAGGTWRRQPGPLPSAARATPRLASFTVPWRRFFSSHRYSHTSSGSSSSSQCIEGQMNFMRGPGRGR